MKIKKMTHKQIPQVSELLYEAFNDWLMKNRGKSSPKKLRTNESIMSYLELEPEGCLVALEKKKIVGAIFSHVWGKIGWIGPLGVLPEFQERGIGKKLMLQAIDYLDNVKNVTTLGLETMPEGTYNIGLYSKLGFKPAFQTMRLTRPIVVSEQTMSRFSTFSRKERLEISYLSQEDNKEDIFTRCAWLASKIENGLDYRPEMIVMERYNFGDTILLKRDGFIIAFAVCRTASIIEADPSPYVILNAMVIDKDEKEPMILDCLLFACEEFGHKNSKTGIVLYINSSYWLAYEYLLKKGFKVYSSELRMIKYSEDIKAYDRSLEWLVNCSTWKM